MPQRTNWRTRRVQTGQTYCINTPGDAEQAFRSRIERAPEMATAKVQMCGRMVMPSDMYAVMVQDKEQDTLVDSAHGVLT